MSSVMTEALFRDDAYLRECEATIVEVGEAGLVLDRSVFYPLGGGQAGDAGALRLAPGTAVSIVDTRKGEAGRIVHVPAPGQDLSALQPGMRVTAAIDWARRHRLMRLHTTTHLLCALLPYPVNGCSITPEQARMDFDTSEPFDAAAIEAGLARLVAGAHAVGTQWISDEELTPTRSWCARCPWRRRAAAAACGCCASRASTCSPAAAPMSSAPPRSAACAC